MPRQKHPIWLKHGGEAVLIACHVLNRVSTKNSEVTPYEGWKGRK